MGIFYCFDYTTKEFSFNRFSWFLNIYFLSGTHTQPAAYEKSPHFIGKCGEMPLVEEHLVLNLRFIAPASFLDRMAHIYIQNYTHAYHIRKNI